MSDARPALRALASRLGILATYRGVDGRDRSTSDAAREALVAAMGHDAGDEAGARRALEGLEQGRREQLVEPVLVWREWRDASPQLIVDAAAAAGARGYRIELELEDGETASAEGRLPQAGDGGACALPLPLTPPHGYHRIRLRLDAPGAERCATQRLVMAPRTAVQPEEVLGDGPAYGIWANLYAVRDGGGWGHGGLRELRGIAGLAGPTGAAFVGINPLHAVPNRGLEFSPYSPSSRLFRNVLVLDPEAVPELEASAGARGLLSDAALRARRGALEAAAAIDHEAVLALVLPVLRELHATFARAASPQRAEAYARYLAAEGGPLRDFATWEALAEHFGESAWSRWPAAFRDPRSPEVAAFRDEHAGAVDLHCWIQFELDRQLAAAAQDLREAGCALGIYQDLALGSSAESADAWMDTGALAVDVEVGAPPDAYAPEGQCWGFPPFDPHALRAGGYRAWSRLLRAAFAHTGALRIDHAMGLMRLFWIPKGAGAPRGAYVAQRFDELLGVLALESRRHGAVVVAEDLGTVPPELPGRLADWGLLRSAVLYFERDGEAFRPPSHYPPRALATVSTHDLAPLAGQFEGSDLQLRHACGQLSDDALAQGLRERRASRAALVAALRAHGFWREADDPDGDALRDAVHAFVSAAPSVLVGVSLDDLAGERDPVNLPGVPLTAHRSWSRRMTRSLGELGCSGDLRAALEPLRARFRAG